MRHRRLVLLLGSTLFLGETAAAQPTGKRVKYSVACETCRVELTLCHFVCH